jgi:hypothetical protein
LTSHHPNSREEAIFGLALILIFSHIIPSKAAKQICSMFHHFKEIPTPRRGSIGIHYGDSGLNNFPGGNPRLMTLK